MILILLLLDNNNCSDLIYDFDARVMICRIGSVALTDVLATANGVELTA